MHTSHPLLTPLLAAAPDPDWNGRLDLFGRFVGSWDMAVTYLAADGTTRRFAGEWHFGWVLGGRAVQDVLVLQPAGRPSGQTPADPAPAAGSSLRMFDPTTGTWQVCWAGPVSRNFCTLVARPDAAGIRLDGRNHLHEEVLCWRFQDITADGFRWTGDVSTDDGRTWRREQEMIGRRR